MSTNSETENNPSKTQVKRDLKLLRDLGEQLLSLSQDDLNTFSLTDNLKRALEEGKKIKSYIALKRQKGFIGKLMLQQDIDSIKNRFKQIDDTKQKNTDFFHSIEKWRKNLIEDNSALTLFANKYSDVDLQHIKTLIRMCHKEDREKKAPMSRKKLFRYISDIVKKNL